VKAQDVADLLDAAGYDVILIETVGVGQSELDIADATDTTVVVLVPESGDAIQAMKSGLMEIADIFVMNKSDRDGSDQAVSALKTILTMRITHAENEWVPDVVRTVGTDGTGVELLVERIARHRTFQEENDLLVKRRHERESERLRDLTERYLHSSFWDEARSKRFEELSAELLRREISPVRAARILAENSLEVEK
jgi:LAO/AO transport system kinase